MPEKHVLSNQREQEILTEIRLAGGSCRIGHLAHRLSVSDETVRRNIKSLESNGLVRKVHGGVLLADNMTVTEMPFHTRMDKNAEVKKALATHVAGMISDGDSLFLDIGSTTAYIAQALRGHKNLYIVTNSLAVAQYLVAHNNNRVFMAGGELRTHDGGAFGQDAINFIRRFTVQFAMLSVGAINAETGFMLHDLQEADLACEAIRIANTRIVVADSTKIGQRAPIAMINPGSIDMLVTDLPLQNKMAEMLANNEIETIVVRV